MMTNMYYTLCTVLIKAIKAELLRLGNISKLLTTYTINDSYIGSDAKKLFVTIPVCTTTCSLCMKTHVMLASQKVLKMFIYIYLPTQ